MMRNLFVVFSFFLSVTNVYGLTCDADFKCSGEESISKADIGYLSARLIHETFNGNNFNLKVTEQFFAGEQDAHYSQAKEKFLKYYMKGYNEHNDEKNLDNKLKAFYELARANYQLNSMEKKFKIIFTDKQQIMINSGWFYEDDLEKGYGFKNSCRLVSFSKKPEKVDCEYYEPNLMSGISGAVVGFINGGRFRDQDDPHTTCKTKGAQLFILVKTVENNVETIQEVDVGVSGKFVEYGKDHWFRGALKDKAVKDAEGRISKIDTAIAPYDCKIYHPWETIAITEKNTSGELEHAREQKAVSDVAKDIPKENTDTVLPQNSSESGATQK